MLRISGPITASHSAGSPPGARRPCLVGRSQDRSVASASAVSRRVETARRVGGATRLQQVVEGLQIRRHDAGGRSHRLQQHDSEALVPAGGRRRHRWRSAGQPWLGRRGHPASGNHPATGRFQRLRRPRRGPDGRPLSLAGRRARLTVLCAVRPCGRGMTAGAVTAPPASGRPETVPNRSRNQRSGSRWESLPRLAQMLPDDSPRPARAAIPMAIAMTARRTCAASSMVRDRGVAA